MCKEEVKLTRSEMREQAFMLLFSKSFDDEPLEATIDDNAMTNVTAAPIPIEVSTFDDTPKKGQIPRNCANTTLFTNIAPMIIAKYESSITIS